MNNTCLFICLFAAISPLGIMQMDEVVKDKHALILNLLLVNYSLPPKKDLFSLLLIQEIYL